MNSIMRLEDVHFTIEGTPTGDPDADVQEITIQDNERIQMYSASIEWRVEQFDMTAFIEVKDIIIGHMKVISSTFIEKRIMDPIQIFTTLLSQLGLSSKAEIIWKVGRWPLGLKSIGEPIRLPF